MKTSLATAPSIGEALLRVDVTNVADALEWLEGPTAR
jgi:hypothetical protein